jgi:hypothetical protein
MIDLDKLDKEIDELFDKETSNSLTKWLLNKRFGNINKLIGDGKFVSMQNCHNPVFVNLTKGNFNQDDNYTPTDQTTIKAA